MGEVIVAVVCAGLLRVTEIKSSQLKLSKNYPDVFNYLQRYFTHIFIAVAYISHSACMNSEAAGNSSRK